MCNFKMNSDLFDNILVNKTSLLKKGVKLFKHILSYLKK